MEQPKDTTDAKVAGAGGKTMIPEGMFSDWDYTHAAFYRFAHSLARVPVTLIW